MSVAVIGAGMATPVGLSAPASCAAIRCRLSGFSETRFIDKAGEWLVGAEVPLSEPWRGEEKLARMAASALAECLALLPPDALAPSWTARALTPKASAMQVSGASAVEGEAVTTMATHGMATPGMGWTS